MDWPQVQAMTHFHASHEDDSGKQCDRHRCFLFTDIVRLSTTRVKLPRGGKLVFLCFGVVLLVANYAGGFVCLRNPELYHEPTIFDNDLFPVGARGAQRVGNGPGRSQGVCQGY